MDYAEIQDGVVRHVARGVAMLPVFSPTLGLDVVDVTGQAIDEGMLWDGITFSRPPTNPTTLTQSATQMSGPPSALMVAHVLTTGEKMPEHVHPVDQYLDLRYGALSVTINGITTTHIAPALIILPAHLPHRWEAMNDQVMLYSVFAAG